MENIMKIMNQKVEHKRFGRGTIFALKDQRIYVSFGKIFGEKAFSYPQVFEEDMKMCDEEAQEEVLEDIRMYRKSKKAM